jgi:hypothetical protein
MGEAAAWKNIAIGVSLTGETEKERQKAMGWSKRGTEKKSSVKSVRMQGQEQLDSVSARSPTPQEVAAYWLYWALCERGSGLVLVVWGVRCLSLLLGFGVAVVRFCFFDVLCTCDGCYREVCQSVSAPDLLQVKEHREMSSNNNNDDIELCPWMERWRCVYL